MGNVPEEAWWRHHSPPGEPRRTHPTLKNTREQLDIITAYQELGSYRAAAKLCGTTDKTVKQIVERQLSLILSSGPT